MDELLLTDEQERVLLETWNKTPNNPPDLATLTSVVFNKPCDGRSKEARAVKIALAQHNLRGIKTTADVASKTSQIELSEAHKLYITNNASTMNAVEMAKVIFNNPSLTNLSAETRAVNSYVKSLDSTVIFSPQNVEDIPDKEYTPPKTIDQVIKRVGQYIYYQTDKDKLTPQQKKDMSRLIGYLHTYRFIAQMNNFSTTSDRKLCEDAFIRYTYDKPDLTQEEVDQYIELANQVVRANTVQRRQEHLEELLEQVTGNDPETMKISMSLVEAIGKASTEYHQCEARKEKLFANLTQKRSARLDKQLKDNASVLNLIQVWKTEEGRTEWLKHAEREQAAIADEVDKLTSMSELKARIFGLTKDEIKYG